MSKAKQVRQIRILSILLLGVLATALAVFVIGPRFTEPNTAQEQAAAAISEKAILDIRYIVLGQKAASLDSAKSELEEVSRKYLSNRTQFPSLSSQILQAATSAGIAPNKIYEPKIEIEAAAEGEAAAGAEQPSSTQTVPVSVRLSAEGSLPVLNAFLKALSNMEYIIVIEAIKFSVPEQAPGAPGELVVGGTYILDLTGKAFMLPPVDLTSPATPDPTDPNATPAPTDPNATPAPAPSATQTPAVTPSN